jgi:hypothetical protein
MPTAATAIASRPTTRSVRSAGRKRTHDILAPREASALPSPNRNDAVNHGAPEQSLERVEGRKIGEDADRCRRCYRTVKSFGSPRLFGQSGAPSGRFADGIGGRSGQNRRRKTRSDDPGAKT